MINVLVAYPYVKVTEILRYDLTRFNLLLDSGAFTAWKSGKPIPVEEYCDFIESLPVKPWRYIALDVIGDRAGTERNLEYMLGRGLTPMPVFTRGEDPAYLDELYKVSDCVAIGGLVGTGNTPGYVKFIMRHAKGRKVHLLGYAGKAILSFRPYSCDSSSHDAARFGRVNIYLGNGRWEYITSKHPRAISKAAIAACHRCGVDIDRLCNSESWSRYAITANGIFQAAYIEDVYARTGVLLFAACSTPNIVRGLMQGASIETD